MSHEDDLAALRRLAAEGRLWATMDISGWPFHVVSTVTQHSLKETLFVLWLDPEEPILDSEKRIRGEHAAPS